jgi:hypothetical protein
MASINLIFPLKIINKTPLYLKNKNLKYNLNIQLYKIK